MHSPEVIEKLLAKLDEAGLTPEERAVVELVAKEYLDAVALLQKPGVTMAEMRARFGGNREGG